MATRKVYEYTCTDPVYKATFVIKVGSSEEYDAWRYKEYPPEVAVSLGDVAGATTVHIGLPDCSEEIITWFLPSITTKSPKGLATIMHESYHAASMILRDRGLKLTNESEEAFAYYTATVFEAYVSCVQRYEAASKKSKRSAVPVRKAKKG